MCGRVRLSSDVSEIKLVFSIPSHRPTPNTAPSWNVAPTDPVPVVRYDAKAGERSLDVLRWGLVPFWAKDFNVGFSNINAKAETCWPVSSRVGNVKNNDPSLIEPVALNA
jgi:putative SOS response-associated peptidase YedK